MAWEPIAAVLLIALTLGVRTFMRIIEVEYRAALAVRRAINQARHRAESRLRQRLDELAVDQHLDKPS